MTAWQIILLIVIVLVFLIWFLCLFFPGTRISDYQFLDALSFSEWRKGREVAKRLEKMYGGHMSYGRLYTTLSRLEEEGLVEHREGKDDCGPWKEFRKIGGGKRRRDEGFEDGAQVAFS